MKKIKPYPGNHRLHHGRKKVFSPLTRRATHFTACSHLPQINRKRFRVGPRGITQLPRLICINYSQFTVVQQPWSVRFFKFYFILVFIFRALGPHASYQFTSGWLWKIRPLLRRQDWRPRGRDARHVCLPLSRLPGSPRSFFLVAFVMLIRAGTFCSSLSFIITLVCWL